jgi:hypothetical protein
MDRVSTEQCRLALAAKKCNGGTIKRATASGWETMSKRPSGLRRYTDLSALFYLLAERKLTLLDPQRWDDKNDSYCLAQYRKKKKLKSVLALCFVQSSERYHLWKVFGAGTSGVRIKFKGSELIAAVTKKEPTLRHDEIEYLLLDRVLKSSVPADRLPFVKRYGFQDEREYRLVYGSDVELVKYDIAIPLSCIESIKLNPWLDPSLFEHVKKAVRSISSDCASLKIVQSSLTNNENWKRFADRAV